MSVKYDRSAADARSRPLLSSLAVRNAAMSLLRVGDSAASSWDE
nr:hypothetical protein [Streptomyces deccanensis]